MISLGRQLINRLIGVRNRTRFYLRKNLLMTSARSMDQNGPNQFVRHLKLNDDFLDQFDEIVVIGDIHGCFDELQLLLKQIHEKNNDEKMNQRILKICTGDLVNKGPKSKDVLEQFMNKLDYLSVQGNHDQVIIREYDTYLRNGTILKQNLWIKQLTVDHINYLKCLPMSIEIPKIKAIIVHAGLVPEIPLEEQKTEDLLRMRNVIPNIIEQDAYKWVGYKKMDKGVAWASVWTGPDHVYFGHNAERRLQQHPFATGLDTGAVYGDHLTAKFIMGPRKDEFISVKSLKQWKPYD
ncbi:Serine/threonine-protein phosphatase 1 [Sarcoptes scabiei]|uniref:Serine/threonine-protein phosphatase 1 n=1 Tax=Sarcoptes scabiei TaxID=52283 RepID=A0A834VAK6_SARSC|nr:Serine/threonine-protein phosphatase 1 [Sarcoptes scabiei]